MQMQRTGAGSQRRAAENGRGVTAQGGETNRESSTDRDPQPQAAGKPLCSPRRAAQRSVMAWRAREGGRGRGPGREGVHAHTESRSTL